MFDKKLKSWPRGHGRGLPVSRDLDRSTAMVRHTTLIVDALGVVQEMHLGARSVSDLGVVEPGVTDLFALAPIAADPAIATGLRLLLNGSLSTISLTTETRDLEQPLSVEGFRGPSRLVEKQFTIHLNYSSPGDASLQRALGRPRAVPNLERLAMWLHDHPAQLITAARLRTFQIEQSSNDPHVGSEMAALRSTLDHAAIAVRSAMESLMPADTAGGCLHQELHATKREIETFYGMDIVFQAISLDRPFADAVFDLAVRCLREGLINAHKHGHTDRAAVVAEADEQGFRMIISNPCPPHSDYTPNRLGPTGGFGLKALSRRAHALGGSLKLNVANDVNTRSILCLFLPDTSTI